MRPSSPSTAGTLCWSRNPALTDLLTLQPGNVLALLGINQEGNLFIDVLTLLYGHLTRRAQLIYVNSNLELNIMADGVLVSLQLEMTNNVRDLLARLVRQLPVDLDGNFVTFLCEDGPTARGGGELLVGDLLDSGGRFSHSTQLQQGLLVAETGPGPGLGSLKPNARSLAGSQAG